MSSIPPITPVPAPYQPPAGAISPAASSTSSSSQSTLQAASTTHTTFQAPAFFSSSSSSSASSSSSSPPTLELMEGLMKQLGNCLVDPDHVKQIVFDGRVVSSLEVDKLHAALQRFHTHMASAPTAGISDLQDPLLVKQEVDGLIKHFKEEVWGYEIETTYVLDRRVVNSKLLSNAEKLLVNLSAALSGSSTTAPSASTSSSSSSSSSSSAAPPSASSAAAAATSQNSLSAGERLGRVIKMLNSASSSQLVTQTRTALSALSQALQVAAISPVSFPEWTVSSDRKFVGRYPESRKETAYPPFWMNPATNTYYSYGRAIRFASSELSAREKELANTANIHACFEKAQAIFLSIRGVDTIQLNPLIQDLRLSCQEAIKMMKAALQKMYKAVYPNADRLL